MSVSEAGNRKPDVGRPAGTGGFAAGVARRWRWIVWPTLIAALGSSAYVMTAPPRFTGVAEVRLGAESAAALGSDAMQSQAEAVASPDLAREAVEQLGLAANPEFNPSGAGGEGKIDQRMVDAFLARLTVVPAPGSQRLQIEFVSRDPELAARGANTMARVFVRSRSDATALAARAASQSLSQTIGDLRAKVADADAKVAAFRAAGASGEADAGQQLQDLNAKLTAARAAQSGAEAKVELLRRLDQNGKLDEAPAAVADDTLRRLVDQRASLKAQIVDASRTLLPLHPRMKDLNAQLAGIDAEVHEASVRDQRLLENEARLASDQVATLSGAVDSQSKTVATASADDPRLPGLETDAKVARDQLESAVRKSREAAARDADGAPPADARIVATAEPPRAPAFPKTWPTILLASLAAFLCSLGVAAAATLAAGDARRPRAARIAGQGSQSEPPASEPETQPEAAAPDPAFPEPPPEFEPRGALAVGTMHAADDLAARVMRFKPAGRSLSVLIVADGTGRALALALETARSLSKRGSALLVDLGATQAWLSDIIDREDSDRAEILGLTDLIEDRAGYAQVIGRDLSSSLDVIASGGTVGGEGLEDIFAALASAYDCVVFHGSDWRAPAARAAAEASDVIVVTAAAARLTRAIADATATLGDACSQMVAYAEKRPIPARQDRAA